MAAKNQCTQRETSFVLTNLLKENPTWTVLGINFGPRNDRPRNNRMFIENRALTRKLAPKTQVVFHSP